MPTHMRSPFAPSELQSLELAQPFIFSKNCRLLKIQGRDWTNPHIFGTLLFDLQTDPHQDQPIQDEAIERKMKAHLLALMRASEAPPEQYQRLGLD